MITLAVKLCGPSNFVYVRNILPTNQFFFYTVYIFLFKWISVSCIFFQKIYPFLPKFIHFWQKSFTMFFYFLLISIVPFIMSPCSFLILFTCAYPFFFLLWINISKCVSFTGLFKDLISGIADFSVMSVFLISLISGLPSNFYFPLSLDIFSCVFFL